MTNFVQKLKLIYELKKNKNIRFRNFTSQQINKGKKTKYISSQVGEQFKLLTIT